MTEEDEEHYGKKNICRICEENNEFGKVKNHCHFTGKYRGPVNNTCNINVTQRQSSFIPFIFLIFS